MATSARTAATSGAAGALRSVAAVRYVTPLREGGSLPGLVEADDDGMYVVKFRGAGQGPLALAAEVVAGELARALGLPVPELVLVDVDAALAPAEPDQEVQELLTASAGANLGVDFLPGALGVAPAAPALVCSVVDPRLAADVVWFDALVTNVDRTPRNPNLLEWHRQLYLIDHGSTLYRQHAWTGAADAVATAGAAFPMVAQHVLLPFAEPLPAAHERLGGLVTPRLLREVVARVPAAWLDRPGAEPGSGGWRRDAYVEHLRHRVAAPAAFVREAENARTAR